MKYLALCLSLFAAPAMAQTCGGSFSGFITGLKQDIIAQGHSAADADTFLASARQNPDVLAADRRQGHFQRSFVDFSGRLISSNRLNTGTQMASRYDTLFDRIDTRFGVPRGILLAFWAFETDFGGFQGDFNTLNALVTLAHDCRRPELFRPQIFAAFELWKRGDFSPSRTTGAWAGEIGQVQMLPHDILVNGTDGDGDGQVTLKTSSPDALMSGAAMLSSLGWRPNEPWLQEIILPATLDWSLTGLDKTAPVSEWAALGITARTGTLGAETLPASVLLPMGSNGPAFLAYPNYSVLFEWNKSYVYVTTAAYFGTRLSGAPRYDTRNPDQGLTGEQITILQQRLANLGYDVGGIDGILGANTRAAVQAEQQHLGLPADAWPTPSLLNAL